MSKIPFSRRKFFKVQGTGSLIVTGLALDKKDNSDIIFKFNYHISQSQFLEIHGIRSNPEIYQPVIIDQNTNLTVMSDKVIIIHRMR